MSLCTRKTSERHLVSSRYAQLIAARVNSAAFHPHGTQRILDCGEAIFVLLRESPTQTERVLCLVNVSEQTQPVWVDFEALWDAHHRNPWITNLITGQRFNCVHPAPLSLEAYQTLWLCDATPEMASLERAPESNVYA